MRVKISKNGIPDNIVIVEKLSDIPSGYSYVVVPDSPAEIAARAAQDAQDAADQAAKQATYSDNVIQYLVNHTPAECSAYVAANVTNLASAVSLLQKFAMALSVLAKKEFRQ